MHLRIKFCKKKKKLKSYIIKGKLIRKNTNKPNFDFKLCTILYKTDTQKIPMTKILVKIFNEFTRKMSYLYNGIKIDVKLRSMAAYCLWSSAIKTIRMYLIYYCPFFSVRSRSLDPFTLIVKNLSRDCNLRK